MILTVQQDCDKKQGTNLPMFSRSGKSTTSQYQAFNNARKLFDGEKDYSNEIDPS